MEPREEFASGDNNTSNGNSLEQKEAQAGVFEDGQIRDTTGPIRQEKDAESYVYGDSRPDQTEPSDTFVDVSESPMMTTTRESFPEAHKEDPAFLEAHRVDGQDEIQPQYNRQDGSEGQVLVAKEKE